MDFDKTVTLPDTVFAQEVDGELVLLDMATEHYFGLDAVASDIWQLLVQGNSLQQTFDTMLKLYDVDPDQLENDIDDFVNRLVENKLASLE